MFIIYDMLRIKLKTRVTQNELEKRVEEIKARFLMYQKFFQSYIIVLAIF